MDGTKQVVITQRFDQPNHVGTVAVGYVTYNGEFYGYREVDWPLDRETAANIAANRISGDWDEALLAEMDWWLKENNPDMLALTGQTDDEISRLLGSVSGEGNEEEPNIGGNLVDNFIVPPFSILDTRQGYWQDRKRKWLATGIKSEVGRAGEDGKGSIGGNGASLGAGLQAHRGADGKLEYKPILKRHADGTEDTGNGTSIFDPVLCEIAYRWFGTENGSILDPFAGGSVRGIIAGKVGRSYTGLELRAEQVEANRAQGLELMAVDEPKPTWIQGDSNATLDTLTDSYDMIFSCPPYADLEVYSDDPDDLSNMPYDQFVNVYRSIIKKSVDHLKDDRFIVWVVGEVRSKDGHYYNFVGDTIKAFTDAGAKYYNEMILINSIGSLAMRAPRAFNASRKIGKGHQNILVFYKGDTKRIKANFGELDFSSIEIEEETPSQPL
jgi:DNA modification methylase